MNHIDNLTRRTPALHICKESILATYEKLAKCFESGGRLYICGNGGSAADALHIVGELVKSFVRKRSVDYHFSQRVSTELLDNLQGALPAFAIVENSAFATAYANDVNPDYVFAQQVYAYVRDGDCVLGISTSGNSKNILHALEVARGRGAKTLGLTGNDGGKMKELCDICITVPETETYKIQELHMPVYHTLCIMLEEHFWGEK